MWNFIPQQECEVWVDRKKICWHFRENPRLDNVSLKNLVMKENKCYLSRYQGYRTKKIAKNLAKGIEMDQYNKLPQYINKFERNNSGSIEIIDSS